MATVNGQEDALNELIAAKQWKQAFNMCEKKLKKAADSETLLVARIKILLLWSDRKRFQQGINDLEALLERKPPVSQVEALHTLDEIIDKFVPPVHFTVKQRQTWKRAADSRPQDEKLHVAWYKSKFDGDDLKGAQLAAMTWMKNFSKERKPFFLYILVTHLLSERASSEQEKTLMQNLAYRCLCKATTSTKEADEDARTTGRRINTYEDRSLLLKVFRAQSRLGEAIEFLANPLVGLGSMYGMYKWELTREYLDLLEIHENWISLRGMCGLILDQSHSEVYDEPNYDFGKLGDDWKIWQSFVLAHNKINSEETSTSAEKMIQSFCNPNAGSTQRNARLTLLFYYSTEVFEGKRNQSVLLTALLNHFRDFSTKIICFVDIQPWLAPLSVEGQKQLLLDAATLTRGLQPQKGDPESTMIFWITSEINLLKLEYHLIISQDWNVHRVDLLTAFVSNCLRLYRISLHFGFDLPVSDRRPGDDAALLAAMALIRLFKIGRKTALIQCILVLEHILLQSKHNYDALLVLVRLYMFLGAGSLALDRYNRLSIKNIQHATVSWIMYPRLSTIHPLPANYATNGRVNVTIAPVNEITNALRWHQSAEDLSRKAVHRMQENGQWGLSLDAFETSRVIANGFARCLLYAELRRIERFSLSKAATYRNIPIPQQTTNSRDCSAFPDFEGGELTFEQHLPMAGSSAMPDDAWLQQQLFLAYFWDLLHTGQSELRPIELDALDKARRWDRLAFTPAEHGTVNIVMALAELYFLSTHHEQYDKVALAEFIFEVFVNIRVWLLESSKQLTRSTESGDFASILLAQDLKIPIWSLFHELFAHLEQCKFIIPALDYAINENKKQQYINPEPLTDALKEIKDECTILVNKVRRSATDVQDRLRDRNFLQRFEELVIGDPKEENDGAIIAKELENLGPRSDLKKILQDLKDSWIDALDGVIQIKLA